MSELYVLDAHDFATEAAQIEVPEPTAAQAAQQDIRIEVEYIRNLSAEERYGDIVDEEKFLTVEETLTHNSSDRPATAAAKLCLNELLSRTSWSKPQIGRHWPSVPENVRRAVLNGLGKELIRRGIVGRNGRTTSYWCTGYRQRAPKAA